MLKKAALIAGVLLAGAPAEAARYLSANLATSGFAYYTPEPKYPPVIENDYLFTLHTDIEFTVNLDNLIALGDTYIVSPDAWFVNLTLQYNQLIVGAQPKVDNAYFSAVLPAGLIEFSAPSHTTLRGVGSSAINYTFSRYALYRTAVGLVDFADFRVFESSASIDDSLSFQQYSTPLPEPSSWALLVGGFGAMGGALRSRRKAAVSFG